VPELHESDFPFRLKNFEEPAICANPDGLHSRVSLHNSDVALRAREVRVEFEFLKDRPKAGDHVGGYSEQLPLSALVYENSERGHGAGHVFRMITRQSRPLKVLDLS